ncbi:MAG: rod shape-determining protein MreD [Balneolaceae bacterium]
MKRSDNIRTLAIGLGIVAVQFVLLRHLTILGAESDLVLLFILWLCTKRPKIDCLIYAGMLGLLQDSLMDLWGLHMFSKTLVVFMLHDILNRISENRFLTWQIFLVILAAAFLHNLIFFMVSSFAEVFATGYVGFSLLVISSGFTAIVGSFLHLVRVDI